MKIQYKFLIIFLVVFVLTIIPNLFLIRSEVLVLFPLSFWSFLSIFRFVILIALFMVAIYYWVVKPLKQIAFALMINDPSPVEKLKGRRDEIGQIGNLLQRFFAQRETLDKVMKEKSQALESVALSEAKARALLNAIPDLMFRVSSNGIITDYHAPDPAELLIPPEEFLGKKIDKVMPSHVVSAYYQAILNLPGLTRSSIFEYLLHMPDGSERTYEALVSATGIGDYLLIVRNITIRKEAELEIAQMLTKQKELIRLKSHFISMVSHEFKTPLAAISSNVQLLCKYQHKWPVEKRMEVTQRVQGSIKKMIDLLEEVTLISKEQSETVTLQPEAFRLKELIHDVTESLVQSSELPVNLEFSTEQGEEYLHSDRELLRLILFHLISSAGKFNPHREVVRASLSLHEEQIEMSVSDNRTGIPGKEMDQLFQPFHRGSEPAGLPGSGWGMTIVKRCVELLNGSIQVDSRENEGTIIDIKIPFLEVKQTDYEQNTYH